MAYLHGVETVEVTSASRTVTEVRTAVIGLVGIAPAGPLNTPTVVVGDTDAAQFGSPVPGFNIPQALDAIFAQGAGTVVVVNIFDPATMTEQVTDEAQTVKSGKLVLSSSPIGAVTIKDSEGAAVEYTEGTDYSIDAYGNFKVLSTAIADDTVLKFSYKKLDATTVTAAALIGTVAADGSRTGIKCWDLTVNLFGYKPKILIAPGYAHLSAVSAELLAAAAKFRAIALIDADPALTTAQALTARNTSGSAFNTSNKRAYLLFPYLKAYDEATDTYVNRPYSSFMAGVIAAQDNENGYWYSPSNREINGITGGAVNISAGISDASSDANQLNAAGITTIFNTYGTGIRTWGNRDALYPSSTDPLNFVPVQRVADTIYDSMEQAMLDFIDKPVNNALIDAIKETGNAFIRTLIQRGALVDGSVTFNKNKNPSSELANGHIVFDINFMPPTPGERITFDAYLDTSLLSAVTGS